MRNALSVLLAMAMVGSTGNAQAPKVIDTGTMVSTSNTPMGVRTSTEEFTIVQNADGGFTLTVLASGDRTMRTALTTDSKGNPLAYEHHGKGGEAVERTITSKRENGGPLVIAEKSSRNPPASPFSFPPDTILFSEGSGAQLWFLGLSPVPRDITYFRPGLWTAGLQKGRVTEVGPDTVTIEGIAVPATRLALRGGIMQTDFWIDSQKRILKTASVNGSSVSIRTKRPQ